ncbi:MAG: hypothetical protein WA825_10350, partial [Steroidobacteraceae bacterium]
MDVAIWKVALGSGSRIFADCKQFNENSLESPPMVAITEQFQILAVGECAAIRNVLSHCSVAHRFRLESCPLRSDIMASIDRVSPDLILVDADGTDLAGLEACRALKDHPATMMLPIVVACRNSD